MMWQHFQNWLRFHPEKYCFPDYLEVCSHQLQTSLALSNTAEKDGEAVAETAEAPAEEAAETTAE